MASESPYFDLGDFHRSVSTQSEDAQIWFNRGFVWSYAYNHEEAIVCFKHAIQCDEDCAMAYWGLAYALGPNYNKPWAMFDKDELDSSVSQAHNAANSAQQRSNSTTLVELALCHAIVLRYPSKKATEDPARWNERYAEAMTLVYEKFPNDLDVAALYADALMNLTPWSLWDLSSGEPAKGAHTLKIKSVLDRALQQDGATKHPGILHLYIHLMEMSRTPEVALPVANHLRGLVSDAGHLNHMPTHLDVLCGDYGRVMSSNQEAIRSDERFVARRGAVGFYTLYRVHNYHFCIYGALFAAQSEIALETVARLEAAIPEDLLRVKSPPMADWLEGFYAMRVHVLIRFGRWQDIMDLEIPQDKELYCVTIAMTHYAKGVALAATNNVEEAIKQRDQFAQAVKAVPGTRTLFNNTCHDILAIAGAMLGGEIEYRRGNYQDAFAHLRDAIHLDDSLPYDEPWGWMQPTRHAYGALLLEQGQLEEAASVYRADLGLDNTLARPLQHPNNVWSLHGYHECLKRLGHTDEAEAIEPQLKSALVVADIPILSSCFCRQNTSKI